MIFSTATVCFPQLTSSESIIFRIVRQPLVAMRRVLAVVQSMSTGVDDEAEILHENNQSCSDWMFRRIIHSLVDLYWIQMAVNEIYFG